MILKCIFDRSTAFVGLLLSFCLIALISILIIMIDGFPVFFVQERVGKNGQLFRIHKFRTMRQNTGSSVSVAGEKRITALGSILRKYKLDELPELWDVLIGNMSLVGPRPDVPGYADRLTGEDREILSLLPGVTGPATLKYRNEEELLASVGNPQQYNDNVIFPDKVRLNRYYLHHYSFVMDLKILLATLFRLRIKYAGEII